MDVPDYQLHQPFKSRRMAVNMKRLLIISLIASIAMVAAIVVHRSAKPGYLGTDCSVDIHRTSSQFGTEFAELRYTVCSDLGGSYVGEILIHGADLDPNGALVFKFDPSSFSGPVKLSWLDVKTLKVSVDRVDFIQHQVQTVGTYSVEYQIGAVGPKFGAQR
jgi:hypothetical protein